MNLLEKDYVDENTAIKRMNYLRGLFAIMIVIGHCSMRYEKEVLPWLLIHKFNMVSVCFFFIVSGWSLCYNFYNKDNYLRGFIIGKPVKLFVFAFICQVVTSILKSVILQTSFIIDWSLITSFNWYIYELIVFYLMFYLSYRYIKGRKTRVVVIWIISGVVSILAWYLSNNFDGPIGHAYHFSSLCFAWGIMLHENYPIFQDALIKKSFLSTFILLIVGSISCVSLMMPQGSFLGGVLLHNLTGISVMTIIAIWSHRIDYRKIPVIGLLTKYATEIYLYQFMVLDVMNAIFNKNGMNINYVYVMYTVVCTLALAMVMNVVDGAVSRLISKGVTKRR